MDREKKAGALSPIGESVSGRVVADPFGSLAGPVQIRSESVMLRFDSGGANEGFAEIGSLDGVLGILSFRDDLGHHTSGSAAMIAPGLAICADHVVGQYLEALKSGRASAVCSTPTRDEALLWEVGALCRFERTDLAIASLRLRSSLPSSGKFRTAHATTRMPRIGDRLYLTGFSALELTQRISSNMSIDGLLRATTGEVTDVYPRGTDRVMNPGPAFAVKCKAFGGMSGGPVFDDRGYLVGIVSSSFEGDEIAFVAHIWPALITHGVMPQWPPNIMRGPTSLMMMGAKFGFAVERPEAFRPIAQNGRLEFEYQPWR